MTDTSYKPGFIAPFQARYALTMSNDSGASEQTSHRTKARVRAQIRNWEARKMTCCVSDTASGQLLYEGPALGF